MDLACDFYLPADVITDPALLTRLKELRLFPFPESADEIAAEADAFRKLSVEDRLSRMIEMLRAAKEFLDGNPAIRAAYDRYKDESEAAWQQAQRELFKRFW